MIQPSQTPFIASLGALLRRVVMVLICLWGALLSLSDRAWADGADQLTNAGQIWYNASTGYVENIVTPSGGNTGLPIEYVWLYKTPSYPYYTGFTPNQSGATLSIWQVGYTPGMIVRRCARRQGCNSMLESNDSTITAPSCPTITISPSTLPNALQGVFYGVFTLTASGGTGPYSWSLQSGSSPPPGVTWVQVGDTLEISGVPTTPGSYSFTFKATDSSNFCNGTKTYTMNVVNTNISVGDRLWNDVNKNGIQDAGEPGLSGRTVYLLDSTGAAVYQSTVTDSSGYYQMDYITAGNYRIGIDQDPNRLLAPANATADANDSDLTSVISGRWVTDVIALSATTVDVDGGLIDAADYGDLPAPYPTTGASAAYHSVDSNLRLGLNMDIESAGQPNATATGDDVAGSPDDEDAITAFPSFTAGASSTVQLSVKNSTGAVRYLNAFFDWNADGDFADAGEAIATLNIANNAAQQTVSLTVPVPAGTTSGAKGARFRLSATTGLASTGAGGVGEVEDYYVTVACPTITVGGPGSFPAGTVGTAYPNQTFTVSGGATPYSWAISPTIPGLTISSAGVLSGTPTAAGTYNCTVSATDANNCSGTKAISIVISACPSAIAMLAGESYTLSAAPGVVSAFWLVNTGSGANPIAGANGLTYVVTMPGTYTWIGLDALGCVVEGCCPITFTGSMDFGDLPDLWVGTSTGNYQTLVSDSGPGHWTNSTLLRLGLTVDTEANGQPNATASGDGADEDGIASMPTFVRSNAFTIPVSVLNNTGSTARVFAFIDWNNDGDFLDASEAITAVSVSTSASQQTVNVTGTVPATAALGSVGARFRVSTAASLTGTGVAIDGEVEDYLVTVACPTFAWNPASLAGGMVGQSYNQTVAASGGVSPYTYAVTGGALPAGLSLDPNSGVISGPPSTAGTSSFTITATAANGCTGSQPYSITISPALTIGNLVWADLNNNGTKDASEVGIGGVTVQLFNPGADNTANTADDVQVGSNFTTTVAGAYLFTGLGPGNYFVKVTPPSGFPKTGGTPATTDNNVDNNNDGSQPGGPGTALFSPVINLASGAESTTDGDADANTNMTVDFGLFSGFTVGNCVWNDANANGIKDGGELGIAGLTVELLNGSGVSFSPAVTTTTNASGLYGFLVYAAGTYKVKVTPNTTYPLATVAVSTDTGIDNDSNGIQSTQGTAALSPVITLTAGGEPGTAGTTNAETTIDFGFLACPTIAALTLPDGVAGTAYNSGTAFSITPAFGTYTWTATGLPSGLTLNSSTAIITGTTTDIGAFRVVVTATGSNGCVATRVFPLKITGCGQTNVWAWNWDSSVDLLNGSNDGGIWKTVSLSNNLGTGNMTVSLTMDVGTNATQGLWFMIDHGPDPTTTDPNYAAVYLYNGAYYVTTYSNAPTVTHTLGTIITSGTYTTALSGSTRSFNFTLPVNTINSWAGGGASWKGIGFPLDAQGNAAGNSFTPYRIGVWVRSFADGAVVYNTSTKVWTVTWGVAPDSNIGTWDLVSDFGSSCCPLVVKPSTLPNGTVGTAYPTTTMDADWGIAPYTWSVSAGALPTGLGLNNTTGVLSGTPSVAGTYNFTIRAADAGTCVGTQSYTVVIGCPTITVTPGSLLQSTFGTAYTQTTNPSASGISGTFTWAANGTLPLGMTVNATNGAISTTTATPVGLHPISIRATSATYTTCSGTWSGNFRVCPIITVTLPSTAATVGTPYSQTVTASGGTPAYTFALNTGALPTWATLNPTTGVLSGTPNNTTPATFTLKATDSTGCVGVSPSYTISPVCPTITVTPGSLLQSTFGTAYTQTTNPSASGISGTFTWAANGTLPLGMTVNATNGAISTTTATPVGLHAISIRATSASYTMCSGTWSGNFRVCPIITVTLPSTAATVGTPYSQTVTASGGTPAYTFALNSGALPTWATLNPTTGVLSGTPNSTTPATFTLKATDANGCVGISPSYTITPVCPAITVTLPSTSATVGTLYSQTVTASGGTAPYTFALNSGSLPTWATLNPTTGVLSGTPNNTTPATFTLKATDANGCVGVSPSYTITPVCPTIAVTPGSLLQSTFGTAYTQTTNPSASGISGTFTWSLGGTPPTGMTINSSTGALSTTTASPVGLYAITVTATSASYPSCSGTWSGNFRVCPVITVTLSSTAATVGTPYSQTVTASGGTPAYTFGVNSGALPTWATLNPTTGVLSGTPNNTTPATFTLKATDSTGCVGVSPSYTITPVCPTITVTPGSLLQSTFGTAYTQTTTPTATGISGTFTWTLGGTPPTGMTINSSTGALSTTTASPVGLYAITVTATSASYPSCSGTWSGNFRVCPIITVTLPSTAATVGTPYSQTVTASGGTPSYTFALNTGALPTWATLNPTTGVLSGTPNNTTPATFTLKATDSTGCVGVSPSYTISPVCPTITVTPGSLLQSTFGTAYTQTTTPTATGISGTFTWTLGGTPPTGMTINPSTGALSTTTASPVGLYAITVTATSSSYPSCAGTWSGNFRVCPIITVTLPSTAAIVGTPYSQTVTASGGTPSYTFALNTGALPTWATLNPTTGVLSGTPNNTTPATFTLKATDSTGCVGVSPSYTISPVCPTITVTPGSLLQSTFGTAYTQTTNPSASGISGTFTWTANGTLPTGMTVDGINGAISTTTATPVGLHPISIRATSASYTLCSGTWSGNWRVCPVITVALPSTAATVGTPYSQTVTASGGTPSYTFALNTGALPTWATLNPTTGVLSGTPNNTTPATFTLKATDSTGCVGVSPSYTITPVCPAITVTLPSTSATVGTLYSQTVTASGGTPSYTFALNSGALPTWATLNPTTGVLSGTPNNTTPATFTLKATDSYGCVGVSPSYTITPVCPTIAVTPGSLLQSTFGTAYTQTTNPSASGISGTFTWTLGGTPPTGMTINSSTGALSTTTASPVGLYAITVTATSASYPSCSGTWSGNFRVCPIITVTLPSTAATVGTPYSQTVTASGGTPSYTFALNTGALPTWATLNPTTGVLSGTPNNTTPATFTLKATDSTGCVGVSPSYTITPVCPTITVTPGSLLQSTFGTAYTQTTNPSASGITGTFTWSLGGTPPTGMTINSTTGALSTTTASPVGLYAITVTATSASYPSCSGTWSGNFRVCPIITVILPSTAATVGTPYSQTVTASGGTPAYTFGVNSGALPTWATLNPTTGVLSGTPNNTTPATFTLKATDSTGCVGVSPSYTITPVCPTITVTPGSLLQSTFGTAYTQTTNPSASGISGTFTWTANGTLPTGMTVDGINGAISTTTATPVGLHPISIRATSATYTTCSGTWSGNFRVCPIITVTLPSTAATVGTPYSQTVTASGGTPSYTFALNTGALPTWATLNPTTGVLSGTPNNTTPATFTLKATDSTGCVGVSPSYTITPVCPTIAVTPGSLLQSTFGTAYTQTTNPSASGISGTFTWTANGTLPTGMTVDGINGAISTTTATPVGLHPISIRATSASYTLCSGTWSGNWRVCPVITVTLPSTAATVGTPYSQTVTASGGTPAYTFALNTGALPTWATLNPTTGVLSGTPNNTTPATFTLKATDANGCVGISPSYTITPVCPAITVTLPSTSATVGTLYSQTVTASGGTPAYTFALNSGALPTWATLNPTTGVLSGTPNNTTPATFTLKSTDSTGCVGVSPSYTITPVCPTITVTPGSLLQSTFGTAYTQTTNPSASGISGTFTWTANGALPLGMAVNSATGAISTTTSTPEGLHAISIRATSASYPSCSGTWSGNWRVCPVITLAAVTPTATVGTSYTSSSAASGGTAAYFYSTPGPLPPGLSLSSATGQVAGIPTTPGTYNFTVSAVDANGCPGSRAQSIVVTCPTMTLSPSSISDGFVNNPMSVSLSLTGGTAPFTWSINPGSLPPGLVLGTSTTAANTISGTPTTVGTYTFTVRVQDTYGCVGTQAYTVNIRSLKVGNLVWSDTNDNGIKDTGENGIAGVTVELWKAGANNLEENGAGDDSKVTTDVVTNASGIYSFINLPAGTNYYVRIPTPPLTNAVTSGTPVTLDNGVDNDNNGRQTESGKPLRSPLFNLAGGTEPPLATDTDDTDGELTIDFGLTPTVCVGNIVFNDVDHNGLYNTGDTLIDNVTVKIFASGADPLVASAVATTISSGGGVYRLCVKAGSYFLHIPPSDFAGVLSGLAPTLAPAPGAVSTLDDNADQNLNPSTKPYVFGASTGVFTLAVGGAPASAQGETGYQSATDDAYDTNSNLTLDLGLFTMPVGAAPLAGTVRKNLSVATEGTSTPVAGVEVALYADANGDGQLNTTEMSAVDSAVTDASGSFEFQAVKPGQYLVVQTLPAGVEALADTDGGDADTTHVMMEGRAVNDLEFVVGTTPDTYLAWQTLHEGAETTADGDAYDGLLEYALGTSPEAADSKPRFWVECNARGGADAVMIRPILGHLDVKYHIEGSSDLKKWKTLAVAPAVTANTDGSETVRYVDVVSPFVRLVVELDADHNGSAEALSTSPVYGWTQLKLAAASQTFSMPLMKAPIYTGSLNASTSVHFDKGRSYYAEIIAGEGEGRCFEINEASSGSSGIVFDGEQPEAGAKIAVRAHWTVAELFPVSRFEAAANVESADRLMFFDGKDYHVLWLKALESGARWVWEGDASGADAGSTIVGPTEGVLVHPRTRAVTLPLSGEARTWVVPARVVPGSRLIGSGSALTQSPAALGWKLGSGFHAGEDAVASDRLLVWDGDSHAGASAYTGYFFVGDAVQADWKDASGAVVSDRSLVQAFRAVMLVRPQTQVTK